ncbi:uncharacterized protein LOC141643712 [Silene latifolia]|uniref:uncharacterized protein LOC141643712 n=1 Tax=Silene latifolia TaxID=37657 RepID=UPI003D782667
MASSPGIPSTPAAVTAKRITITPGSRILDVSTTPLSNGRYEDSAISKRLRDAGFDEDSVRRRDKAALIAYIAKLEAEIYDLQHNMGLLIMEKKDSASNYDEVRLSAEKAEVRHLREKATLSSALSEAKKREDNLKKALGVEKQCVTDVEKALHEMRAECAEVKVSAESRMAEARSMVEDAQQKLAEAEVKLRAAESMRDEARRSESAAGRKLLEVEAREDDLRRRMSSFKSDCDAKENEIKLERQSLAERQRVLSESQNKLLDSQALLNQREADILSKSQALKKLDRELEDKKENIAAEMRVLMEQKSNLEINGLSLSEREKVVIEKEVLLNKKEQELLVSQEMLASKEHKELQKVLAEQEIALTHKREEFEAELMGKQKAVDEDIEKKRRAWELRELDLQQREDLVLEKEQNLEVQSRVIADKGRDLAEKMKSVQERECNLEKSENEVALTKSLLQKEREEMDKAKIDLERSLVSWELEKKQISEERMKLELLKSETSELFVLEGKLKEEIDRIRAQKQQLDTEAEKLMVEKAKFESEWEFIDVKRDQLQKEEDRIAEERVLISEFLKEERDSLNLEKEKLREQYKQDLESLIHDREAFMSESQRERTDWFSKFQKERADFLLEIEFRKRELDDCVNKRRDDIEALLREKETTFEEEKKRELQRISSLKEDLIKEQERVDVALKKLETEKLEIKLDREQRDQAWAELQHLIEELHMQRLKLKKQRELLHEDRENIHSQIEQLKKLEDVNVDSDTVVDLHMQKACIESTPQIFTPQTHKLLYENDVQNVEGDSPRTANVSWLKKCASLIFKHPSEESKQTESSLDSTLEGTKLGSVEKELLRIDEKIRVQREKQVVAPSSENACQFDRSSFDEPKVIHEVPSIDEEVTPLETEKHERGSSVPSPQISSARKRKMDTPSAPGTHAELQNDAALNKKRRHELGDALDNRAEIKQPSEIGVHSGISHTHVEQSEADQSVEIGNDTVTCIIKERTVIQEAYIVNGIAANRPNEKAHCEEEAGSELAQQDADPSEAKVDKPEAVKQRGKRRSKSKAKI